MDNIGSAQTLVTPYISVVFGKNQASLNCSVHSIFRCTYNTFYPFSKLTYFRYIGEFTCAISYASLPHNTMCTILSISVVRNNPGISTTVTPVSLHGVLCSPCHRFVWHIPSSLRSLYYKRDALKVSYLLYIVCYLEVRSCSLVFTYVRIWFPLWYFHHHIHPHPAPLLLLSMYSILYSWCHIGCPQPPQLSYDRDIPPLLWLLYPFIWVYHWVRNFPRSPLMWFLWYLPWLRLTQYR